MSNRRMYLNNREIPRNIKDKNSFNAESLLKITNKIGTKHCLTNEGNSDQPIIEGICEFIKLSEDIQLHTYDALELQSAHSSIQIEPSLHIIILLNGDIDAAIDGYPLRMIVKDMPKAYLWIHDKPAQLDRWIRAGQTVRKINISIPINSIANHFKIKQDSQLGIKLSSLASSEALNLINWSPSLHTVRLSEDILRTKAKNTQHDYLSLQISALSILKNALTNLVDVKVNNDASNLKNYDNKRARLAYDFIQENLDKKLNIDLIAKNCGMSISTLQKVFKASFGLTVIEFLRIRRLELARLAIIDNGISITEAAFIAGYSNTSNFSTAFLKEFGYSPSHCTS